LAATMPAIAAVRVAAVGVENMPVIAGVHSVGISAEFTSRVRVIQNYAARMRSLSDNRYPGNR